VADRDEEGDEDEEPDDSQDAEADGRYLLASTLKEKIRK
jgi:hypothetical protein